MSFGKLEARLEIIALAKRIIMRVSDLNNLQNSQPLAWNFRIEFDDLLQDGRNFIACEIGLSPYQALKSLLALLYCKPRLVLCREVHLLSLYDQGPNDLWKGHKEKGNYTRARVACEQRHLEREKMEGHKLPTFLSAH